MRITGSTRLDFVIAPLSHSDVWPFAEFKNVLLVIVNNNTVNAIAVILANRFFLISGIGS